MAAQAYLFTGPEFGAKGDKIDSIKADLKKRLGDVEFSTCYVSENPVSEVVSTLQSGSLFSASSCVVYREAELIKKKDDVGALSEWLASASDSQNVLILVSDEISVDKKLEEIVPKQNRQIFWEISEDRKNAWIRDFFSKNGFGIEDDAVSLILDMVEGDTLSLRTECSPILAQLHNNFFPAHRRTLATTKAELRTKKHFASESSNARITTITRSPHHGRCASRAPAHACYNQAELRTKKHFASAIFERENSNHHAPPPTTEGAPSAHRRTLATTKPNLERTTPASANSHPGIFR